MDLIMQIQPYDTFKTVAEEVILNVYKSQLISIPNVDSNIINLAKEELRNIILANNFDIIKVKETIQTKKWERENVNCFLSSIEEHKSQLLYLIIIHVNSKYGEALIDFNWVLKLVYGTSDSKALTYPVVQLELSTITNEQQKQNIYDFNKETLGKLISVLENSVDA